MISCCKWSVPWLKCLRLKWMFGCLKAEQAVNTRLPSYLIDLLWQHVSKKVAYLPILPLFRLWNSSSGREREFSLVTLSDTFTLHVWSIQGSFNINLIPCFHVWLEETLALKKQGGQTESHTVIICSCSILTFWRFKFSIGQQQQA